MAMAVAAGTTTTTTSVSWSLPSCARFSSSSSVSLHCSPSSLCSPRRRLTSCSAQVQDYTMRFNRMRMAEKNLQHVRCQRLESEVHTTEMVAARTPITFHIGETSLTIPFSLESAKGLSSAISGLLTTFKEKEQAGRPQRWNNMEYRQTEDGVFFEVFCNPNAHATAFQAKYLITINDEKLRITSEGQLSSLKNDVDTYIDVQG